LVGTARVQKAQVLALSADGLLTGLLVNTNIEMVGWREREIWTPRPVHSTEATSGRKKLHNAGEETISTMLLEAQVLCVLSDITKHPYKTH